VASLGGGEVGQPRVTPSRGDTLMKVNFFGVEFYKGYWRKDQLEGGEGRSGDDTEITFGGQ